MPFPDLAVIERVLDVPAEAPAEDSGWVTWLHNDPINLAPYVVAVLGQVCSMSETEATEKMLEAHTRGATVVFAGGEAEAKDIASQLLAAMLWASAEKQED